MLKAFENKDRRLVVGMMSGTSVDGVDAALVEISGSDDAPSVRLLAFSSSHRYQHQQTLHQFFFEFVGAIFQLYL